MGSKNKIERFKHSLELDENLALHLKGWKIQKISWLFILGMVVLTALGLFGQGPLSKQHVAQNNIAFEYERFSRYSKETVVRLQLKDRKGAARIAIPFSYIEGFRLESVVPEADQTDMLEEGFVYTFTNSTEKEKDMIIHFYLYPRKAGRIQGTWTVNQSDFKLSHFIYP